jgi:hypothetical protein
MQASYMNDAQPWSRIATEGAIQRRSMKVALIVGSVLNLINQGAEIASLQALAGKILLTFCVPYCVATYGAVMARRDKLALVQKLKS